MLIVMLRKQLITIMAEQHQQEQCQVALQVQQVKTRTGMLSVVPPQLALHCCSMIYTLL